MLGYVDEAEHLKSEDFNPGEQSGDEETKEPILKVLKMRLFYVFFRLNSMKVVIARHYYMLLITIETFHLLSIVLNDGSYSVLGPYEKVSPWNTGQTQWLIDICWGFRIDRFLRTNLTQFIVLVCIWASLLGLLLVICLFLGYYQRVTSLTNSACKVAKVLITLITDVLFIPICDTFAFGTICSFNGGSGCLNLSSGYMPLVGFIAALTVFLGMSLLCAILYYDMCMVCGNAMAKPHSRFKLLRIISYAAIIFTYYFIDISGKVIVFLIVSLVTGVLLCYVYTQYIPYYNLTMCKMRLGALMTFTSAVFCLLIGEFFKSTDQTNSSVSMLFYFLTPCLVQIILLAMTKRGKILSLRKFQQITNIYQVEIKGRMLVFELEAAKLKSVKSLYLDGDQETDPEFQAAQTRILTELESLYLEAYRKFPNSEFLYLWSGMIQLHLFKNYILAMVQCFKGNALANKLDSQYAFSYFRRTSASFYKANMKDDAFEFVQFEKCSAAAQKNDETATRSQFFFWAELETKTPRIQKLMKIATELTVMVVNTKTDYQRLLKLNSKSSSALRMFGGFLQSLNGYAELGQRYLQKAESQDNPDNKQANPILPPAMLQPLSFFDSESAIFSVSGDFETIGEIKKVGVPACSLFGYLQAEFVGRNISLVIPEPFASQHDEYMRHFHESGHYSVIDAPTLILYFLNKNGFLFEARLLLKVVPNQTDPPFFMAAIKPTKNTSDFALIKEDLVISGYSQGFSDKFDLGASKTSEQKITGLIPNFEEIREKMMMPEGVEIDNVKDGQLLCKLSELNIGQTKTFVIKVQLPPVKYEGFEAGGDKAVTAGLRAVSTLKMGQTHTEEIPAVSLHPENESPGESESESDSSEDSDEDESSGSEEESSEQSQSVQSVEKRVIASSPPGMVEEGELPDTGNEAKPLMKRNIHYSDVPDILYDEPASNPSKSSEKSGSKAEESQSESSHPSQVHKSEGSELSDSGKRSDEQEVEPHSLSSKSVNSSMASTAQFNKAIKALMSFEFTKISKDVLRFKVTLFLTIVILIATSVTTFKVIENSVSFNQQLSHYVNLVGNLRLESQSVSYYSRMLSLMDAGLFPKANRSMYETWMTEDTTDMHAINLELFRNFQLLTASDRLTYFQEAIPVWIREGLETAEIKSNLFDATSNLVVQAFLLQQENSNVSFSDRRVYYLYRNGMGETLDYLNKSAAFYVAAALTDLGAQRLVAIMLIVVSVILLVFCAGFAIIPTIRSLEISRREVWEIFFEIPIYVCRIMRGKCTDRLQLLNESANVEIEEMNQDDNKEDGAETAKSKNQEKAKTKADKSNVRKKKQEARRGLSHDPRRRKVVIIKLFCFFLVSLVYFYLIYYTGFDAAGQLLREEPIAVDWASRRRHLSRAVNHWVTESLLENVTDLGYKFLSPFDQTVGSPSTQAWLEVSELEFVENALIFGEAQAGLSFSSPRSQVHDSLLFSNACIAPVNRSLPDCVTVAEKALDQGLHSALGMYLTLAKTVLLQIGTMRGAGNYTLPVILEYLTSGNMALLRSLDDCYLYDPLLYSSQLYESDYSTGMNSMKVWQNLLISLYIVFAVLFYAFVYHPMIHKVRNRQIGLDAKDAWSMCALIPQEYQEEFKSLMAVIKERRDSFKWR